MPTYAHRKQDSDYTELQREIHCIYLTKFVTLTLNYSLLAKPLTIAHHTEINKGTFWNKTDLFTDLLIDFSEVIIDSLSTFCVG